jgi:hypothetical protein
VPDAGLGEESGYLMGNDPRQSAARPRSGKILRHWTTNDQVFVGKSTTSASRRGDWGLADARRLNLIASKLKSLASAATAP